MAKVFRLAGAILAETDGEHFLVGNTKMPCDWGKHGFEAPVEIDPLKRPFLRLAPSGEVSLGGAFLVTEVEGEDLARELASRLLIERNGSVSDRLWRLILHRGDPDAEDEPEGAVDAEWLFAMPRPVWQIVRETVLRCV
jgi:hypothetical protein